MKKQTSFRLSKKHQRTLDKLADDLRMTKTAVIESALDALEQPGITWNNKWGDIPPVCRLFYFSSENTGQDEYEKACVDHILDLFPLSADHVVQWAQAVFAYIYADWVRFNDEGHLTDLYASRAPFVEAVGDEIHVFLRYDQDINVGVFMRLSELTGYRLKYVFYENNFADPTAPDHILLKLLEDKLN